MCKLTIQVTPEVKEYLWQLTVFDLGRISQLCKESSDYWYKLRHEAREAMLEAERGKMQA